VAANVLMDAAQELRRSVPRIVTTPSPDPAVDHIHLAGGHHTPALNPAVELAEVLQDAVNDGVLDPGDAELIAHTRIAGHRVADIAHHRGLRPRTLWDRRQRAERTLAHAHARSA
jgi:AcrR family transcriptional regulator